VKTSQPTLNLLGAREKRHSRDIHWELWSKEASGHIEYSWQGNAWIVELITTTIKRMGKGKHSERLHLYGLRPTSSTGSCTRLELL
jgi:hypothetical protein